MCPMFMLAIVIFQTYVYLGLNMSGHVIFQNELWHSVETTHYFISMHTRVISHRTQLIAMLYWVTFLLLYVSIVDRVIMYVCGPIK